MIRERGFAFVELLVSIAIFVGIGLALLTVVLAISRVPPRDAIAPGGTLAVEQEIDELRSDAATSFAVFVPDRDVHGGVNVDPASGLGHEVDFYSRDDAGGPVFWAYLWDAAGQTARTIRLRRHPETSVKPTEPPAKLKRARPIQRFPASRHSRFEHSKRPT